MSKSKAARRKPAGQRKPRSAQAAQPRAPQTRAAQPLAEQPSVAQPRVEQPEESQSGPGWAENLRQQLLGDVVITTCWLDPGEGAGPYPASVKFSGRWAGVDGRPRQGDRFDHTETLGNLVPGSGPVSVTVKVQDVAPGEWTVWARPDAGKVRGGSPMRPLPAPPADRPVLRRSLWSKGNPVAPGNSGTRVTTRPGAYATGPGLVPAWRPTAFVDTSIPTAPRLRSPRSSPPCRRSGPSRHCCGSSPPRSPQPPWTGRCWPPSSPPPR